MSFPHFIIVGAQRCGTTSLFYYLSQHPELLLSSKKEIHYFDRHYQRGSRWYESFFPKTLGHKKTGEASPNYLLSRHAARRIARDLPEARLIVLLRNPIDRAYSHFQGKRVMGVEPLATFEQALEQEAVRTQVAAQRLATDANYYSASHRNFSYIARGMYFQQIRFWLDECDRSRMLFVKSENLFREPTTQLELIHRFLGIAPVRPADLTPKGVGRLGTREYPPIREETRAWLTEVFRNDVRRLARVVGPEFDWF